MDPEGVCRHVNGEALEAYGGDGDQGVISDRKRGNNNKTTSVNQAPTHGPSTLYVLVLISIATMQVRHYSLIFALIYSSYTNKITSSKR